jgi:hypothetical protein
MICDKALASRTRRHWQTLCILRLCVNLSIHYEGIAELALANYLPEHSENDSLCKTLRKGQALKTVANDPKGGFPVACL